MMVSTIATKDKQVRLDLLLSKNTTLPVISGTTCTAYPANGRG